MFIREPSCVSVNCPELYPDKSFPSMSRYQQRYILGWLFIRVGYDNLKKEKLFIYRGTTLRGTPLGPRKVPPKQSCPLNGGWARVC